MRSADEESGPLRTQKREPVGSPLCLPAERRSRDDDCRRATRRPLDLAGGKAARADLHLRDLSVDDDARDLKVRLPGAAGLVVGVRDVVAEGNAFRADVALVARDRHGLALDQFDARHLSAVTLAVAGLEDARVAALARGEAGTELLKELVRGRALGDVHAGQTARVQRAGTGLRDELLDERTEFLRLRLGGLDGALEDQRGREIPKERDLLPTSR
jgi:hypothetical protein